MYKIKSQKYTNYRPLGSYEHLLWLYDQAYPLHFVLTAKVRGELEVEQLKIALAQVQQRQPLLRVHIAVDEAEQPWFVESTKMIELRVVIRQSDTHWEREVERELSLPFDWTQAPLIRVVLLHSLDISELIVTCHHSIADGMSAFYLIRDILQAIANKDTDTGLETLPLLPPQENLIPTKSDGNLHQYVTNNNLVNQEEIGVKKYPSFQNLTYNKNLSAQITPKLCSGSLLPEITKLLILRCRQEKTSVHAAICAAFLMAITAQNCSKQPQTMSCLSAINIRGYLVPTLAESFGVYNWSYTTPHNLTQDVDFWELSRSLKQQLSQQMIPEKIFEGVNQRQEWVAANPSPTNVWKTVAKQVNYDLAVSNLGRLECQNCGNLKLEAIYGPVGVAGIKNERSVGVATVGEQLFFTLVYSQPVMSSIDAQKLKNKVIQLLNAVIN